MTHAPLPYRRLLRKRRFNLSCFGAGVIALLFMFLRCVGLLS